MTPGNPNLLVIMPTRDRPFVPAWQAASHAAAACGCPITIQPGQPRDFNRNRCVQFFLEHARRFEWLLFVDDDTVIPLDAITRLLAVGQPIVSAIQPLWVKGALVANVKLPDGPDGPAPWPDWVTWQRPEEPFQIGFCGFGCILIHRSVLTDIGHPWFEECYGDVWGQDNRTEDVDFCLKAAAKGIAIHCDPRVVCGHWKNVDLTEWLPRSQIRLTVNRPTSAGE